MLSTSMWVIIIIGLVLIDRVLFSPWEDYQRFKLFEARDKITFEVLEKRISENDKFYRFVLNNLNFWLYYTDNDYDFSIVINNILRFTPQNRKEWNNYLKGINNNVILQDAWNIARRQAKLVMRFKGFVFTRLLLPSISLFLQSLLNIIEFFSVLKSISKYINESLTYVGNVNNSFSLASSMYK